MEFLSYLFFALPFVMALLLAIVVVVSVWSLATTPTTGAVMVLVATSLEAAFVALPPIRVGINIFLGDLVSILLALALLLRARHYPWASPIGRSWLVFGLFMFASFFVGLAKFGVAAGSDFRTYFFYFWAGVAYFLAFDISPQQLARIRSVFIGAAVFIGLLACARWGAWLGGVDLGPFQARVVDGNNFRVVSAGHAVVIAVGALFLMQRWLLRESGLGAAALSTLMLLVVLALQHRSVWGAVILGFLGLIAMQRKQLGRGGGAVLWVILGVAVLLAPLLLLGVGSGVQQSVGGSVQEAFASRSTFTGRFEGWRNLLTEWSAGGIQSYVAGQPFGSGYARQQQGFTVSWTPHNYYVHVLLRTGVFGLLAMLFAFLLAAIRLIGARNSSGAVWMPALLALIVLELAFFVPYSALFEQAIFCGMALSVAARLAPKAILPAERPWMHRATSLTSPGAPAGRWGRA